MGEPIVRAGGDAHASIAATAARGEYKRANVRAGGQHAMAPTRRTRSQRAGLTLPVSRVQRRLRAARVAPRVSVVAPVYACGALEYLVAELLELAGNVAHANKKKRINPRHLLLAARNDAEFSRLLARVTIPSAGVVPAIHPNLARPKAAILKARLWQDVLPSAAEDAN